MKASEVLQQYKAGKRDFKHVNLRGQSFRKANLADTDFSYADIRGTNFSQANLAGSKFTEAKAGLQKRRAIGLFVAALVLLVLSASFTSYAGFGMAFLFVNSAENSQQMFLFSRCVVLVTLGLCYFFLFRQGISGGASVVVSVTFNLVLTIAFAVALSCMLNVLIYVVLSISVDLISEVPLNLLYVLAVSVAVPAALTIVLTIAITLALTIATVVELTVAVPVSLTLALYIALFLDGYTNLTGIAIAIAFSLITLGLNIYLAYRAYQGDERDAWVRGIGIAFAATGGTSFSGANLTDTDFSQAILKNTNFRNAKLIRTCFRDVKKLDFARLGGTILTATPVRKLVVDGNGAKQDYTDAKLRGANLDGANLEAAILKYADLSEASLVGANLQAANLTEAQAVGTNFTQARLTGACLEAWNIDSTTVLQEIECLWVYLAEKEQKNSSQWGERRPNSGEFAPGEFTQIFTEILDTVDLIFQEGVDWKAFVAAFKKAEAENNVSMHSIKNIGEGAIEVKLKVPPDADKEKIHSTFTQDYQQVFQELEKCRALLDAKEKESEKFHEILRLLASNPNKVEIQTTAMSDSKKDSSQNISVGGDFNIDANNAVVNLRDISGKVSNTIQQLPETTTDAPGIKELLTQLQTAIETETELTDKSKEKALKQVQKLAAAGENPQANQDDADDSLTMLKGIVSGLQETAKLVTTCQEIIPLLTGLFGLV